MKSVSNVSHNESDTVQRHKVMTCVLFPASSPGQDLTHQVTAERQPLQMSPLPKDQELGDWHRLQRHTPPQLHQGEVYGSLRFMVG